MQEKKRRWKWFVPAYIVLAAAFVLTFYLLDDPSVFFRAERAHEQPVYGAVFRSLDEPFYEQLNLLLEEAVELQGGRLLTRTAGRDAGRQAVQIRELAAQGVRGLYVCVENSEETALALREVRHAGLPVVALESAPAAEDCVDGLVVSDNWDIGRQLASWLIQNGGQGRLLLLTDGGLTASAQRFAALRYSLQGSAGIEIAAEYDCGGRLETAEELVAQALAQGVAFDTVVAVNDRCAIGALSALTDAGVKDVRVLGVDGEPQARQLVIAGFLSATLAQRTNELVDGAAWMMQQLESGDEDMEREVLVEARLIYPANTEYYGVDVWL